jgi:hypothetical protein
MYFRTADELSSQPPAFSPMFYNGMIIKNAPSLSQGVICAQLPLNQSLIYTSLVRLCTAYQDVKPTIETIAEVTNGRIEPKQ